MPRIFKDIRKYQMGDGIVVEKVVDISDIFRPSFGGMSKRVLIMFTLFEGGRYLSVHIPYRYERWKGSINCYLMDNRLNEHIECPPPDIKRWNKNKQEFIKLVRSYMPKHWR